MEILRSTLLAAVVAGCALSVNAATVPVEGVELHPGVSLDEVTGITGLGAPVMDMAIDPLSKHLFIGQSTDTGGNILEVDPGASTVGEIPFFSQGLSFAPDGTLYFGVSNLLLATWRRDTNVFRIFTSLPRVRDVQVAADGQLYVGVSAFGPSGLYTDAVLRVDRQDGFFEPVLTGEEVRAALGQGYPDQQYLAVTSDGTIMVSYHTGENIRRSPTGTVTNFNTRDGRIGGLNNAAMAVTPDDLTFHYDVTTGQLFALWPDGSNKLVAYGEPIKGVKFSDGAMATDGKFVYFVSDTRKLFRLSVTAGTLLKAHLSTSAGVGTLTGTVRHPKTGAAVVGATITLNATRSTTTDADGVYRFDALEAGLYEYRVTAAGFPNGYFNLVLEPNETENFDPVLQLGLPDFVAPGLVAELMATKSRDNIVGSADVFVDKDGLLYSMNNAGSTISKIKLTPDTRDYVSSQLIAEGGNMANAWFIVTDNDLNFYTSSGNNGVMKLPPQAEGQKLTLTVNASDGTIVTDQTGVNRIMSKVRDSDGGVFLSNGDYIMGSGTGGSPIPGFPEGTFNTLVRRTPAGVESFYSRGFMTGTTTPIIINPDVLKIDNQDRIYVTNRNGDVVRILPDCTPTTLCSAEMLWPGNGSGKPLDGGQPVTTGAFSSSAADTQGNVFVRGATATGSKALRMISPDGNNLLMVANGLLQDFGGIFVDQGGRHIYISDNDNVVRIRSLDARSIAENMLAPPPGAVSITDSNHDVHRMQINTVSKNDHVPDVDYAKARIDWILLQPKATPEPEARGSSSGGGFWLWPILVLAVWRLYRLTRS